MSIALLFSFDSLKQPCIEKGVVALALSLCLNQGGLL
jgi:hypothetical protein